MKREEGRVKSEELREKREEGEGGGGGEKEKEKEKERRTRLSSRHSVVQSIRHPCQ